MSLNMGDVSEDTLNSSEDCKVSIEDLLNEWSYNKSRENFKRQTWEAETEKSLHEIIRKIKYIENNIEKLPIASILFSSLNKVLEKDILFLKMEYHAYYELKTKNIKTIQQLISNTIFDLYNKGIAVYDIMCIIYSLHKQGLKLLDYDNLSNDIKECLEEINTSNDIYLCMFKNKYSLINIESTLLDDYFFIHYDYDKFIGSVPIYSLGLPDNINDLLKRFHVYSISDLFNIKWKEIFKNYRFGIKQIKDSSSNYFANNEQIIELKQRLERLEFEIALNLDFDNKLLYIIRSIEKNRYNLIYIKELLKNIDINLIYRNVPLYMYIVEKLIGRIDKKQIANIIKYFIDIGANLDLFGNDYYDNLLIMLSSTSKDNLNVDACKILMEHGADPNVIMDSEGPFSDEYSSIYDHLYDAHYRWEKEEELWEGAGMGFNVSGSYVDDWLSPKEEIEEMQNLFSQYGYLPIYELIDLLHD